MHTQDPYGLDWPSKEAMMHHSSAVNSHGDLHLAIDTVDGNEANTEDKLRREHRLQNVKAETDGIRDKVARIRLELRELRVELQQDSTKIWEMQDRFWWELRSQAEIHPRPDQYLQELHDQIQRSLDEIGPKQASYDEKEDDLISFEYRLEKKEIRLYNLESRLRSSSTAALSNPSSSSSSHQSRKGSPQFIEDESSPAHRYLSRVGDANIMNERLIELREERAHYLDLERDRVAMGFQLYPPNVDFLANFDDVYADHLDQLREINEDIQNLQLDRGLLSLDDVDPGPSREEYSYHRTALLRAQSDQLVDIVHERIRRHKSEGDLVHLSLDRWNSRQSISRWLSERLDIWVIEGGRYYAVLNNPDLDDQSWWRVVQECWQKGRAAGLLRASPGEPSKLSIPAASRDIRGQNPSLTLNEGPSEFENFPNYPVDPGGPYQHSAPDVSWKARTMPDYFGVPLAHSSCFNEEEFSLHGGSE